MGRRRGATGARHSRVSYGPAAVAEDSAQYRMPSSRVTPSHCGNRSFGTLRSSRGAPAPRSSNRSAVPSAEGAVPTEVPVSRYSSGV